MNAQAAAHVARGQSAAAGLKAAFQEALKTLDDYSWLETVPGTVADHWKNPDGTDRTDLAFTAQDYADFIALLVDVKAYINAHAKTPSLYRLGV